MTEKKQEPVTMGIDPGADDHTVVARVDGSGKLVALVERRAIWPDPAKMNFNPDSPDKYNAALRVTEDKPRRRRTD